MNRLSEAKYLIDIVLDIGEDNKIVGIEILDASKHLNLEKFHTSIATLQTMVILMNGEPILNVVFFRTGTGRESVRDWACFKLS